MKRPQENNDGVSRRDFIGAAAATAAAATIVPRHVLGGPGYKAPSDKLNIGCAATAIGIAGVIGTIAQSWLLFILVAAGLLAVFVRFGLIR